MRIRFGCPFFSKVVVCGHCLMTLSIAGMSEVGEVAGMSEVGEVVLFCPSQY